MPYWISIYRKSLCAKYCSFYCWIISARIISSGSFIYSYLSMGLFKYKLTISAHINIVFLVERTMLKMSFSIVRSYVGVVMSPGKLSRFPPTVIHV